MFAFLESKLAPGYLRPGSVARVPLVDRLRRSAAPVVAVIAPAGYGKTTMLRQWAERDPRPFAWISVDEADNDPATLVTYLAAALDRMQPIDAGVFAALDSGAGVRSVVVPRLGATLFTAPPFVLVVDGVHMLRKPSASEHSSHLSTISLPERRSSSRGAASPASGWRACGRTGSSRRSESRRSPSMSGRAGSVLAAADVRATADEVAHVREATEGWPAGVYFAALSIKASGGHEGASWAFSGNDEVVRDYLALELLSNLSASEARFVLRSAALDEMCGPLCDAALGESGSSEMLDVLEQASLFVVPLDRERHWYRYHRLCHQMLRSELDRREPGAARDVQRKAAAWCETHDLPEAALAYADAACDEEHVVALAASQIALLYSSGQIATVERLLNRLDGQMLRHNPAISVFGAYIHAVRGRPLEAERWAGLAGRAVASGPLPDGGTSIEPWIAVVRAFMCAGGIARCGRTPSRRSPAWPRRACGGGPRCCSWAWRTSSRATRPTPSSCSWMPARSRSVPARRPPPPSSWPSGRCSPSDGMTSTPPRLSCASQSGRA